MPEPFERGSIEWEMYTAFFLISKKYWTPNMKDPDAYWDGFIHDIGALYQQKYQPFGRILGRTLSDYLHNKFEEVQKNANA